MFKKSLILMSVVLVLLGSIAVAIVGNSKTSAPNHPIPVVTPPDSGTWGYLGDFTIQGTVISKFDRIGAWGWTVHVDKVVEGPPEMKDKTISVYLTSADPTVYPRGSMDPNISVGDIIEAYGAPASGYDISLTGSANYYLKDLGLPVAATHGAAPSGMDKVISNTTGIVRAVSPVIHVPEPQNTTMNYTIVAFNLMSRPSYLVTETGQHMSISWINGTGYVNGAPDLTLGTGWVGSAINTSRDVKAITFGREKVLS